MEETRVFGCFDTHIEVEGEHTGVIWCYGTDKQEQGVLLIVSDGTLLEVKYGKEGMDVWGVRLIAQGSLFDRIESCLKEGIEINSDVVHFKPGVQYIFAATEWEKVT